MSDDLFALGKRKTEPAPSRAIALPYTVQLPTRYYGRLAVADAVHAFAEVATVEIAVSQGTIAVTFKAIDAAESPALVVDEFLNHALYGSATAPPEARS